MATITVRNIDDAVRAAGRTRRIVPIPGTAKLHRLEENLGGVQIVAKETGLVDARWPSRCSMEGLALFLATCG